MNEDIDYEYIVKRLEKENEKLKRRALQYDEDIKRFNGLHHAYYLNVFKTKDVLEVYDEIIENKLTKVNDRQSIPRGEAVNCEFLKLSYCPDFDMVYLNPTSFSYPLFANSSISCILASKSTFLKSLKPSLWNAELMSDEDIN